MDEYDYGFDWTEHDLELATMAATLFIHGQPSVQLPDFDRVMPRSRKAPTTKPDKRAKVKAARAQNVKGKRK